MAYYGAADGDLKWWQLKKKVQAKKAGTDALALEASLLETAPAEDSTTSTGSEIPEWAVPVGIAATVALLGVVAYVSTRDEV